MPQLEKNVGLISQHVDWGMFSGQILADVMAEQTLFRKNDLFSSVDDENLMEEVRNCPNLYNNSMREYRDIQRAENCWMKIEQATGKSASDLK